MKYGKQVFQYFSWKNSDFFKGGVENALSHRAIAVENEGDYVFDKEYFNKFNLNLFPILSGKMYLFSEHSDSRPIGTFV